MSAYYTSSLSNIRNRIDGPLNSKNAPMNARFAVKKVVNGTPVQPSVYSQMQSMPRQQYLRGIKPPSLSKNNYNDTSASSRIDRLKANAIGRNRKSNSATRLNENDARSALRRARSLGTVAPKKKGFQVI